MSRIMGLILALLGIVVAAGGFWLATGPLQARVAGTADALAEARAEVAALETRIAGFQAADDDAALPADVVLPQAGVAEAGVAEAGVAMQERLTRLARAHDVALSSLAAGVPPDGLTLPAAALTVEGEGDLPDVMAFLDALERQAPRLGLSSLMLVPQDVAQDMDGRVALRLSLRLTVWGLLNGGAE